MAWSRFFASSATSNSTQPCSISHVENCDDLTQKLVSFGFIIGIPLILICMGTINEICRRRRRRRDSTDSTEPTVVTAPQTVSHSDSRVIRSASASVPPSYYVAIGDEPMKSRNSL